MTDAQNTDKLLSQVVSLSTEKMAKDDKLSKGQKRKHEEDDKQILCGISVEQDGVKPELPCVQYVKKEGFNLSDNERAKVKPPTGNKHLCLDRSFTKGPLLNSNIVVTKEQNLNLSNIDHDVFTNSKSNLNVTPNGKAVVKTEIESKYSLSEIINIDNRYNINSNTNSIKYITHSIPSSVSTKIKNEPEILLSGSPNMPDKFMINELSTRIKKESEDLNTIPEETVEVIKKEPVDFLPDLEKVDNESNLEMNRASPVLFDREMLSDNNIKQEINNIDNKSCLESRCASPVLFNREMFYDCKVKQETVDNVELIRNETNKETSTIKCETIDNVISNLKQNLCSIKSESNEVSFNTPTNTGRVTNALHESLSLHESQTIMKQEPSKLNQMEESADNPYSEIGVKNVLSIIQCGIVISDTAGNPNYAIVKNIVADLIPQLSKNNHKTILLRTTIDGKTKDKEVSRKYIIVNGTAIPCSKIDIPMKVQVDVIWRSKKPRLKVILMWTGIKPKCSKFALNQYAEEIDYFEVEGKYCTFDRILKRHLKISTYVSDLDLTLQCKDISSTFLNSNKFKIPDNGSVTLYMRKKTLHNSEPIWTIILLILDLRRLENNPDLIHPLESDNIFRPVEVPNEVSTVEELKSNIISDRTVTTRTGKTDASVEAILNTNGPIIAKCRFIITDISTKPHLFLRDWQGSLVPHIELGLLKGFMLKFTVDGKNYVSNLGLDASYIRDGSVISCCRDHIAYNLQFDAFYSSTGESYVILAMWVKEKNHVVYTSYEHYIWVDTSANYCLENECYLDLPTSSQKTQRVKLSEFQDIQGNSMETPLLNGLLVQVYANIRMFNPQMKKLGHMITIVVDKSIIESHKSNIKEENKGIDDEVDNIFIHNIGFINVKKKNPSNGIVKIIKPIRNLLQETSFNFEILYVNRCQVITQFDNPRKHLRSYLQSNKYLNSPWNCIFKQKMNSLDKMATVELMWIGETPISNPVFQNWARQCLKNK